MIINMINFVPNTLWFCELGDCQLLLHCRTIDVEKDGHYFFDFEREAKFSMSRMHRRLHSHIDK